MASFGSGLSSLLRTVDPALWELVADSGNSAEATAPGGGGGGGGGGAGDAAAPEGEGAGGHGQDALLRCCDDSHPSTCTTCERRAVG